MEEKQNDKNRRDIIITSKKVIVTSLLLSVAASLILGFVLFNMFFIKVVRNLTVQSQSLSASMNSALMIEERQENLEAADNIIIMDYLKYYRDTAAKDNRELIRYASEQFPDGIFFAAEPDGNVITPEYCDPEIMEKLREKGSLGDFRTMIRDAEESVIRFDDFDVHFAELSDGTVLFYADISDSDFSLTSYHSPEQVVCSVGKVYDGYDDNMIRAYAVDYEKGIIFTPEGEKPYQGNENWYVPVTRTRTITVSGITAEYSLVKVNGDTFLMVHNFGESARYEIFLCSVPWAEILSQMTISLVNNVFFTFALVIVGLLVFYMGQAAMQDPNNPESAPDIIRRKITVCLFTAVLAIALIAYYTQTLCCLSANVMNDERIMSSLQDVIQENERNAEVQKRDFRRKSEHVAVLIADYYSDHPELVTRESLEEMRSIFTAVYIAVYDFDCHPVLSTENVRNIRFPEDPEDPFYPMTDILYAGMSSSAGPARNVYAGNIDTIRIAASMHNERNEVNGYLEIAGEDTILTLIDDIYSLSNVLKFSVAGETADFVAVDSERKKVIYNPWTDHQTEEDAARFGFEEEAFAMPYFGVQTLKGIKCYARGEPLENRLMYIVHPYSVVYLNRGIYVAWVVVLFILTTAILLYLMRIERKDGRKVIYVSELEEFISARQIDRTSHKNVFQGVLDFVFGGFGEWAASSTHDKISRILSRMLFAVGLSYLAVSLYRKTQNKSASTLFRSISYLKSLRGLNIFALNANIEMIAETIVIVSFLRWLCRKIGEIGDARVETITRLISSALKYISVIYAAYVCLVNFGFDPAELAASAGVLGVAIGIGGRDLITDIIAGLFIVFERDVQVGDVVDVGGYQGRIVQIGMRTTKIIAPNGNEKLFNNRNMTNIVNLSAENSYSSVVFSVPATVSIPQLEEIFSRELKGMKNRIPEFIRDPEFVGVRNIQHGLECEVIAEVKELSRGRMNRVLAKEVKDILDRNGIPLL